MNEISPNNFTLEIVHGVGASECIDHFVQTNYRQILIL